MSPYLYRQLMREKLAQLRKGPGAMHAPHALAARTSLAPRPRTLELFPVKHAYAGVLLSLEPQDPSRPLREIPSTIRQWRNQEQSNATQITSPALAGGSARISSSGPATRR